MLFWLALRVAMVSALSVTLASTAATWASQSAGSSPAMRRSNSAASSGWAAR